jgi:hypothetical protein
VRYDPDWLEALKPWREDVARRVRYARLAARGGPTTIVQRDEVRYGTEKAAEFRSRNAPVVEAVEAGDSYAVIGRRFGVSRARVQQIATEAGFKRATPMPRWIENGELSTSRVEKIEGGYTPRIPLLFLVQVARQYRTSPEALIEGWPGWDRGAPPPVADTPEPPVDFWIRVRRTLWRERERSGYSSGDMARRLGVTHQTIDRLHDPDDRQVFTDIVRAYLAALDIPWSAFFGSVLGTV